MSLSATDDPNRDPHQQSPSEKLTQHSPLGDPRLNAAIQRSIAPFADPKLSAAIRHSIVPLGDPKLSAAIRSIVPLGDPELSAAIRRSIVPLGDAEFTKRLHTSLAAHKGFGDTVDFAATLNVETFERLARSARDAGSTGGTAAAVRAVEESLPPAPREDRRHLTILGEILRVETAGQRRVLFAVLALLDEVSKAGWEYSDSEPPELYALIAVLLAVVFVLNEWWAYQDSRSQ